MDPQDSDALASFRREITGGDLSTWCLRNVDRRWKGVTRARVSQRVTEINLSDGGHHGSPRFAPLPRFLVKLNPGDNHLSGPIDFTLFEGTCLEEIDLSGNMLTGPVGLTCLPYTLLELSINDNEFSGDLILEILPDGLIMLLASDNRWRSIKKSQLPASLTCLVPERNLPYYRDDPRAMFI